jgi:hypothetical protein
MYEKPEILFDFLRFFEIFALFCGTFYFKKLKNNYWKWFVFYLFYIVIYELLGQKMCKLLNENFNILFSYLTIPIEFLFFIWLFALKSLKNQKLYFICTLVYLLSFIPDFSLQKGQYLFNSFNYLVGGFILLYLILLELHQQMKSDDILMFKQNKMFYITIGVALFYIGNLPFFGLYYLIMKEPEIWNYYYIYFMLSNCLMYLLFAVSFIWGKVKS